MAKTVKLSPNQPTKPPSKIGDGLDFLDALDAIVVQEDTFLVSAKSLSKGVEKALFQAEGGTGDTVAFGIPKGAFLVPTSVGKGVTIATGDFEFARIDLSMSALAPVDVQAETYEWILNLVGEIVERDVAKINKADRAPVAIPAPPKGLVAIVTKLTYGITKKTGGLTPGSRTSTKIDVSLSSVINPKSWEAGYSKLESAVTDRLKKANQHRKALESGSATSGPKYTF